MKLSVAVLSSLFAAPVFGESAGEGNAAIAKVVEMLNNMLVQGKDEMQKEKVGFAKYDTWAKGTMKEKAEDIEDGDALVKKLQGLIAAAQGEAAEADAKAKEMADLAASEKANIAQMTKVRKEERAEFVKEEEDLTDTIYACDKAKEALEAVPEHVEAKSLFFTQMDSIKNKHPDRVKSLMEVLQRVEDPFTSARSNSASATVIEMVSDLKADFEEQIADLRKKEGELQHNFELQKQTSTATMEDALKQQSEQETIKSDALMEEAKLTEELDVADKTLKDDQRYLAKVTSEHKTKSKDYEARMKSRADEITAIKKAIEIMKSPEVMKGGGHLEGNKQVFAQESALIQLGSQKKDIDEVFSAERVSTFLRQRGQSLKSKILMQLAEVAQADPFAKVKKMIQELLNKLEEEKNKDQTEFAWCDENMKKNKADTEHYTALSEKLAAQIEKLTTEIADAKDLVKKLTKELDELRAAVDKATTDRAAEKADNEQTIKESTVAVEAIEDAMDVLQKYYNSVKLLQQPAEPAYAGGDYKGMGGQSQGVVGLLQVIMEEMNALISETKTAEADAADGHNEFLNVSKKSEMEKKTLKNSTEVQLASMEEELVNKKDDLTDAKKNLDMVVKMKKEAIDPRCIAQGMTFEEKQKKRQEEIDSLKEALAILSDM
jgi:hypothetical protein